jgi:hypothetical protein
MMLRPQHFCLTAAMIGLLLAPIFASAGEGPAANDKVERLAEMKRQADEYEVRLADKSGSKLTLHHDPLLRFDNPVGGVPDGIVVMWLEGKRPAVFAQVFQTADKLWIHECQSLASAGLDMSRDKALVWQPAKAAGDFRSLGDTPPLAASSTKRLSQLREMAKQFSATDDFKVRAEDTETTRNELRLLPTPVYRYSDTEQGIEEGAVFAFVHGTDPELFLVLENRRQGDSSTWHYAFAPMTCWAVDAKHQGKTVWSVPGRLGKSRPDLDYHVWIYRPQTNP